MEYDKEKFIESYKLKNTILDMEFHSLKKRVVICLLRTKTAPLFYILGKAICKSEKEFDNSAGEFWALEDALNQVKAYEFYVWGNST